VIEGDAVIHELDLPAPVEQVFDMFTDPRRLVRWIGLSADLQPRLGGRFRFEITPGQFCEGQYVIVDRPNRLVFTWGWTDPGFGLPPGTSRVEVTLTPGGDGVGRTRLRLVHTGLAGDLGVLHEDGWSRFLARLTAAAAGGEPAAYPAERPDERLAALPGQGPREDRQEQEARWPLTS
jgi:uncharacterized protein YndB with AHSA1/START domain